MKSVGEVMAIGRHFEEALQKGLRMLEIGANGLVANPTITFKNLTEELKAPTEERIFSIVPALQHGFTVDEIYDLSHIDKWFLYKLKNVADVANQLILFKKSKIPPDLLLDSKKAGFSDKQVAIICESNEDIIRKTRQSYRLLLLHPFQFLWHFPKIYLSQSGNQEKLLPLYSNTYPVLHHLQLLP